MTLWQHWTINGAADSSAIRKPCSELEAHTPAAAFKTTASFDSQKAAMLAMKLTSKTNVLTNASWCPGTTAKLSSTIILITEPPAEGFCLTHTLPSPYHVNFAGGNSTT
jgi:hypothetical protein